MPAGFVCLNFDGRTLSGWEPVSGDWRVAEGHITSAGSGDRFLRSAAVADWLSVSLEFKGGNPGVFLPGSERTVKGPGVDLSAAGAREGIGRSVDMDRWNTVEFVRGSRGMEILLNGSRVEVTRFPLPAYVVLKAGEGTLTVRRLTAVAYNE
jgi:hypothetical protein